MRYFITALTNNKARLIVSETQTSDKAIADMVAASLEAQGHIVVRREEG